MKKYLVDEETLATLIEDSMSYKIIVEEDVFNLSRQENFDAYTRGVRKFMLKHDCVNPTGYVNKVLAEIEESEGSVDIVDNSELKELIMKEMGKFSLSVASYLTNLQDLYSKI